MNFSSDPHHAPTAVGRSRARSVALVSAAAAITLTTAACAKEEEKTEAPEVAVSPEPDAPVFDVETEVEVEKRTGINLDPTLAAMCDMPRQETYFEYDSDALEASARALLEELVDCVEDEQLPGLVLAGHADPRGTELYNQHLAKRRATSVAGYLEGAGLDDELMVVQSFGERDAHADPSMWDEDRRVDIAILDGGTPVTGVHTAAQGGSQ